MPSIKQVPPDDFVEPSIANPLARYFRAPGVHVQLPSDGAFMPPGSIELTMNGQVPVFPMRSQDELLLKSADALMSGYAIEELIKSCVPAIKLPRLISSPDLDVILMAIRAATYGDVMNVAPECPSCHAENELRLSLGSIFGTMKAIPHENPVRLSDEVVAYVRPYNLWNVTQIGMKSFEEARKIQSIEQAEGVDQDARSKQVNESVQRLVRLSMDMLADSIDRVVVQEGEVRDRKMIAEFISNVSKAWVDRLQAKLDEINAMGIDKTYSVKCASCEHTWKSEIEFNPASFFAQSSSA